MDKILTLKIDTVLHGKTIKHVLKNEFGLSTAIISYLKNTDDGIMLNGEKVFVTHRVCESDELVISIHDSRSDIPETEIPLDILYEDEDIIALNKPRCMPTHPSQNHYTDTLANGLMHYFRGEAFTFRAICRLDRNTSGIVLVAKNRLSAMLLAESMKSGKIKKEYVAVTNGAPIPDCDRICAPIKRLKESMILRCVSPNGKEAITDYETISVSGELAFVRLIPLTGRTHQLRVHMSHIGTPIYGDDLYGAPQTDEPTRLHCRKIAFVHPFSKKEIVIEAPVPNDITMLIN